MENRIVYMDSQLIAFKRLSAVLAKLPPELIPEVDEKASIFVAGMEAATRTSQFTRDVRPSG